MPIFQVMFPTAKCPVQKANYNPFVEIALYVLAMEDFPTAKLNQRIKIPSTMIPKSLLSQLQPM